MNTPLPLKSIPGYLSLVVSAAIFCSGHALAVDTWDGGGNNDTFGEGGNWVDNTNPASGESLIFDGTIRLTPNNNYGSFSGFGSVTFAATAGAFTISGAPLAIAGAVTNNSANAQVFNTSDLAFNTAGGINAASGNFTFNQGNLYLDQGAFTIATGAGRTININANLRNGGAQGTTTVTYNGSGTVILNQNAQYGTNGSGAGGTVITGGTVRFINGKTGNNSSSGVGSNNYSVAGGATLEFNVTGSNGVSFDGYSGGTISGAGTFVKSGTGSLYLGGSVGGNTQMSLSAGALIDVQGGTLRNDYGRQNWDNNKASMNIAANATVDTWDGVNGIIVDALNGAGTVQHTNYNANNNPTNTLTVGVVNGTGSFSGTLTDQDGGGGGGQHLLALIKNGTGTQTLSGANTYRGYTAINGGRLKVDSGSAGTGKIGSTSSISINLGSTLLLAKSGTVASTDRVNTAAAVALAGGTLASADSATEGTAATKTGGVTGGSNSNGLGALTLSASSIIDFDSASNANLLVITSYTRQNSSNLTITNWTNTHYNATLGNSGLATDDRLVFNQDMTNFLSFISFGSGLTTTQVNLGGGFYEIGAVPEPSTWLGACLVTAMVWWTQRRRIVARGSQL